MNTLKTLLKAVFVTLVGMAGIFIFFRDFFLSGGRWITGDMADGRLILGLHEHWYRFLKGKEGFFELGFFYPERHVLGYSDTFFLPGLLHAFFRFMGFDPFLSFQFVQIGLCGVGFAGMYYWLHHQRKLGLAPSLFGSFLFIIASPVFLSARNSHFQMMAVWLVPAILILLEMCWNECRTPSRSLLIKFAILSALYGLLAYSTFYISWFLLLYLTIWILMAVLVGSRRDLLLAVKARWRAWPCLVPGILIIASIGALFLRTYLPVRSEMGGRSLTYVLNLQPPLKDLINHSESNLLWGKINGLLYAYPDNYYWEMELGPTVLLIFFSLIVSVFLWRRGPKWGLSPDKMILPTILSVVVSLLLIFKINGFTLWMIPYHLVPGAEGIRVPSRMSVLLVLPMAYLCAWTLSSIREIIPKRLGGLLVFVFASFTLLEQVHLEKTAKIDRRQHLGMLADLPRAPDDAVAFLIHGTYVNDHQKASLHTGAILLSQHLNLPTVSGRSGQVPKDWYFHEPNLERWKQSLMRWANRHELAGKIYLFDADNQQWGKSMAFPVTIELNPSRKINLLETGVFETVARQGWSQKEPWGIWIEGEKALIRILGMKSVEDEVRIELGLMGHLNSRLTSQRVELLISGSLVHEGKLTLDHPKTMVVLTVSKEVAEQGFDLAFIARDAASPASLGTADDPRVLGIGLTEFTLGYASSASPAP